MRNDASIRLLAPVDYSTFVITHRKTDTFSQDIASFFSFRKINVNHSFIQQLQKIDQNLYVVHETIETSEETTFEESTTAEGSFMNQLYAKFHAKV